MAYRRTLGIAPLIVADAIAIGEKELASLFAGHSALYKDTQSAIPLLQSAAIAGNVCAYVVLKSLSGDQAFCRLAIDQCHQIGTYVGEPGPCGAADNATKDMARAAWQAVDANPSAFANVSQPAQSAANNPPPVGISTVPGGSLLSATIFGFPAWLVAAGIVVVVVERRR